jgi:Tfp pilus assembly PilM family ATPase
MGVRGIFSQRSLGLELLDDELRLAEVRRSWRGVTVTAAVSRPIPAGLVVDGEIRDADGLGVQLKAAVEGCKIRSRKLVLAAPDARVFCRTLTVPPVQGRKLDRLVDYEVQHNKLVPFPDPVYDYAVVPEKQATGERKVLLVASPASVVDALAVVARRAGIRPVAVDLAPLALMRVVRTLGEQSLRQGVMVVQARMNWLGMHFFRGGSLIHSRYRRMTIAGAADTAGEEPAQLDRPYFDEVVSEIEQALRFYVYSLNEREHPIEHVWWVGSSFRLQETADWLARALGLPVHCLPDGQRVRGLNAAGLATYAVAVGLALKGAG